MSAKIYAILTVLIIGGVSFLIGWLLTSTRWKKKFFQEERLKKLLEGKVEKQASQLLKIEEDSKGNKKRFFQKENELRALEKEVLSLRRNTVVLQEKTITSSTDSDVKYNSLLNELNLEKKKNASLKADMKRAVGAKKTTVATFTTTAKEPAVKAGFSTTKPVLDTNIFFPLLTPIIHRVSIFSNSEQKDNLTLIDGIDEALAIALNKAGLINFKQLAMLTEEDLKMIEQVLELEQGQSMKKDWVGQARNLYHKKYSS